MMGEFTELDARKAIARREGERISRRINDAILTASFAMFGRQELERFIATEILRDEIRQGRL